MFVWMMMTVAEPAMYEQPIEPAATDAASHPAAAALHYVCCFGGPRLYGRWLF